MADRNVLDQDRLDHLLEENIALRRAADKHTPNLPGSNTGLYIGASVLLALTNVCAIVAVELSRPDADNSSLNTLITGILAPLVLAFVGAGVREVHVAFNSRMSELLALTKTAALAEGQLAERDAVAAVLAAAPTDADVTVKKL